MHTRLGSSKEMVEKIAFSAILSNKKQYNPGMKCKLVKINQT